MQLSEYLDQYGLDEGYLLIFDFRKTKEVAEKLEEVNIEVNNKVKNIVEAYC